MPRRMSVVWRCRCTDELAAEVVITATRLVPMASRMGIPKCSARIGESRTPPPIPVTAPSNPAKKPSSTRSALSMPRLGDRLRSGGGLSLLVSVITGAHQRPGLDVTEPEAQGFIAQLTEFFRSVEARHGQVVARWTQILAYGKNVNPAPAEIAEYLDQLLNRFAQTHHHAALRHHAGREFLGVLEQGKSAFVTRAGAHRAIKARYRFSVVIQNVRPRIEHDLQRLFQTLKIRDQHLDAAIRNQLANLANP